MNYTKLMKLMYISDRESLREYGTTISGDSYAAMNCGPVLSETLNMIKGGATSAQSDWSKRFQTEGYDLVAKGDVSEALSHAHLSKANLEIMNQVFETYRNHSYGRMIDITHTYPEWTGSHVKDSSVPISLTEVLAGAGFEMREAIEIAQEEESHLQMQAMFG